MTEYENLVDAFVDQIKETEIYLEYERQKNRVNEFPDLKRQIDEFRQRNFELQQMTESDELLYKIEEFEKEYERFRENPMVSGFLAAELAFCRMMQDINDRILGAVDFE